MNYRNLKSLQKGLESYTKMMMSEQPELYEQMLPEIEKFMDILITGNFIDARIALKEMENIQGYVRDHQIFKNSMEETFQYEGDELKVVVKEFINEDAKLKCFLNEALHLGKREARGNPQTLPTTSYKMLVINNVTGKKARRLRDFVPDDGIPVLRVDADG